MNTKALSLLGMAMRAGKICAGFSRCESAVRASMAQLVIVCNDISAKTEKEIRFVCGKYSTDVISADFSSSELSSAIGFKCGLCAICDTGFAKSLSALIISNGKEDLSYDD